MEKPTTRYKDDSAIKLENTKDTLYGRFRSKKLLVIIGIVLVMLMSGGIAFALTRLSTNSTSSYSSRPKSTAGADNKQKTSVDIAISAPSDNIITTDSVIAITGTVSLGRGVIVNNVPAAVSGESFTAVVNLTVGVNTINVEATNKDGSKTSKSLTITRNQPAQAQASSNITLSGAAIGSDVQVSWTTTSIDSSKGFYVLQSTTPNPIYTGSVYATLSGSERSFDRTLFPDGKTYYYRICQVVEGGGCGVYSNQLSILAQVPSTVTSITIMGTSGTTINWNVTGNGGLGGYYILWSLDPLPSYPSTGTVYSNLITNTIAFTGNMDHDVTSGDTYYVRVCENLGGKCGTYSNQVTVKAP